MRSYFMHEDSGEGSLNKKDLSKAIAAIPFSKTTPTPKYKPQNETLAYDDPRSEESYQELYKIYQPQKYVIKECLKEQKKRLEELKKEESDIKDRLAITVSYADLDFATALATVHNRAEFEALQNIIDLNEGILRLIDGSYKAEEVKAIPMSEFIKFTKRWARCPFHADTQPSFYYYPAQNRAHCFAGCGQKNVIQVYAQLNGISSAAAYQQLVERLV